MGVGVAAVAGLFAGAPGATAAPPAEWGRITGVVSTSAEARALPCPSTVGREAVGVACFPKRSARWVVDQVDACTLKSDVTTGFRMMGGCVLAIDEGAHVKVWAPPGAVSEDYRLVWR